ncbi:MAG TPA: endonuclease [Euryarchaeota archaeon]|nr:endonuclease [Euryarchaeota archaeon]
MVDLRELYLLLKEHWGHLSWWPAESAFEVAVGAILTQRTAWRNVESAIMRLKEKQAMHPDGILGIPEFELADMLRCCGFYRQKSTYLRDFCRFLVSEFEGDIEKMNAMGVEDARQALLLVRGIGQETADSILLYACGVSTFVIDEYTRRIVSRIERTEKPGYLVLKRRFESELPPDINIYRQFHALLVELGKGYCKSKPECRGCPAFTVCLTAGASVEREQRVAQK